jgi:aspartate kinase
VVDLIVQKFGGTSVEDVQALERMAGIVAAARSARPLVVVSAMGKTTDNLIDVLDAAMEGQVAAALATLARIRARTEEAAQPLLEQSAERVLADVGALFTSLADMTRAVAVLRSAPPDARDAFLAHGERISVAVAAAVLSARGLPALAVDAREIVKTDDTFGRARPEEREIERRAGQMLAPLLAEGRIPVLGGFIGSAPDGRTSTLGRGGSDYSAALLGAALSAAAVEIWTDVDGMMTTDPRVVPVARLIESISFEEASELAYFGARVLHPLTLAPAVERGIPVRVRNSRRPEICGTEIRATAPSGSGPVRAIAFKRGLTTVDIVTTRMLMASGFLATLFDVFARHRTPVDLVATSEVSVSVTVDDAARLPAIRRDLEEIAAVEVRPGRALVCLVGQDLKHTPGIAARIFRAVAAINILMISQGASQRNVSFVVEDRDALEAVRRLHAEFFE